MELDEGKGGAIHFGSKNREINYCIFGERLQNAQVLSNLRK